MADFLALRHTHALQTRSMMHSWLLTGSGQLHGEKEEREEKIPGGIFAAAAAAAVIPPPSPAVPL